MEELKALVVLKATSNSYALNREAMRAELLDFATDIGISQPSARLYESQGPSVFALTGIPKRDIFATGLTPSRASMHCHKRLNGTLRHACTTSEEPHRT